MNRRNGIDPAGAYRNDSLALRLWHGDVPNVVIDSLDSEGKKALLQYLTNREEIVRRNLLDFANDPDKLFEGCGDHSE